MHTTPNVSNQPFPGTKQEVLSAMLAAFSESVILFDVVQKRISFISEHLLGALGYLKNEELLESGNIMHLVHPDDRVHMRLLTVKVLRREIMVAKQNIRIQCFNGSFRWFSLRQVIFDTETLTRANYIFGVLVDIHERKEDEIRIRRQNAAIKEYIFTASHVIRAPLANILGILNIVHYVSNDEADEKNVWLERLEEEAQQLDTILTGLIHTISQETEK